MEKRKFIEGFENFATLSDNFKIDLLPTLEYHLIQESSILTSPFVSSNVIFILSGLTRAFQITDDGKDITKYFVEAEEFIVPVLVSPWDRLNDLEAITEVEIVTLPYALLEEKIDTYNEILQFISSYIDRQSIRKKAHIQNFQSFAPETTYESFLKIHPELELHVPSMHIASYLGLSTSEFLKVRQKFKTRGLM